MGTLGSNGDDTMLLGTWHLYTGANHLGHPGSQVLSRAQAPGGGWEQFVDRLAKCGVSFRCLVEDDLHLPVALESCTAGLIFESTDPRSHHAVRLPHKLPGMHYSANEQCQILFGTNATFCRNMEDGSTGLEIALLFQ
ncbi:hypothetical protein CB1_001327005 [Camelus ferus]|nr:hypothetical protein CB1_001327005 [Camelus ferus]